MKQKKKKVDLVSVKIGTDICMGGKLDEQGTLPYVMQQINGIRKFKFVHKSGWINCMDDPS